MFCSCSCKLKEKPSEHDQTANLSRKSSLSSHAHTPHTPAHSWLKVLKLTVANRKRVGYVKGANILLVIKVLQCNFITSDRNTLDWCHLLHTFSAQHEQNLTMDTILGIMWHWRKLVWKTRVTFFLCAVWYPVLVWGRNYARISWMLCRWNIVSLHLNL